MNAALVLDQEIEERVMDILDMNEERLARYVGYIFAKHISRHPDFEDAVIQVFRKHAMTKE